MKPSTGTVCLSLGNHDATISDERETGDKPVSGMKETLVSRQSAGLVCTLVIIIISCSQSLAQQKPPQVLREEIVDRLLEWSAVNSRTSVAPPVAEGSAVPSTAPVAIVSRDAVRRGALAALEAIEDGPARVERILRDDSMSDAERTVALRATFGLVKACPCCARRFDVDFLYCPYDARLLGFKPHRISSEVREARCGGPSLVEVAAAYQKMPDDRFAEAFPSLKESDDWYLLTGQLELIDLSEIKMYGLRDSGSAVILGQARNIDYYYSTIRPNVGKRIVVGCKWFGQATFAHNPGWQRIMAAAGYCHKGELFLDTFPQCIYRIAGSEPAGREIPYDCDAFSALVESCGLASESVKTIVDARTRPQGRLSLVVMTPVSAVFSTGTATLEVTIEGPMVKTFTKKNVPTAYPLTVNFNEIPQGAYTVTVRYGNRSITREVEVEEFTQVLDLIIY